tara:strand:+ start:62 stop:499 length:438 start_codon:yes stop_codon:yes gene_type:complete
MDCPICLEPIHDDHSIVTLECNHTFHERCANEWLSNNDTCPLCRNPNIQSTTIRMHVNDFIRIANSIRITFIYPNQARQTTYWNKNQTIVDLIYFLLRSVPNSNANVSIKVGDYIFKTTESFGYLNQQIGIFNIQNNCEMFVSFF